MRITKKLTALVLAAAMAFSLAACGSSSASSTPAATEEPTAEPTATAEPETPESTGTIRIAGLKGPTTMGLVNLMSETETSGSDAYEFSMYGSADEVVPLLVKGELDAAAVPANLAATLYQKTNGELQVICVNTLGVLYIVENGETVQSLQDLKGQTIITTGKGTTPEYVLRYILTQNGIDPDKDVTIEFASEATEALSQVQAGNYSIAMLPQPFVTAAMAQTEGLRVAVDITEEWQKVAGTNLITGVMVARKSAIEANPGGFALLMQDYAASIEAANTDLEGTAALCEQYGIVAKAAIAQKALPACNIVFESGETMKTDLSAYLQVLYDADASSVGGTMPGDDFYYAG